MDATTLHYLVSLVVSEELTMQLMDVVISYLYGDLDMKINPSQVAPDHGARLLKVATLTIWIDLIRTDVVYPSK